MKETRSFQTPKLSIINYPLSIPFYAAQTA